MKSGLIVGAAGVLGAAIALCAAAGGAQAFPDKPVRIIVPFPPGGGNDIISRSLADGMTKDLGRQVIVENKPGGGTVIGTDYAAKSTPDGHTVLIASFAFAVNPSFLPKLPYDHATAFAPITLIARSPNIVIVPPDRPFKTMQALTAHAKANPGKLNYGSFGNGTSGHLAPELYKLMAKVDIVHIPYKGTGPASTDLIGGRLDLMFATLAGAAAHIRSKKVLPLAVTSAKRSPAYPDLPTIAESGVPGFEAQTWYGILAPRGTPQDRLDRLHKSIAFAAGEDGFRKRSEQNGLQVETGDGKALATLIAEEETRWRRVVTEGKIKPN
jgi:tripartite-type tricarboxylate transporter receptor subunit TctC